VCGGGTGPESRLAAFGAISDNTGHESVKKTASAVHVPTQADSARREQLSVVVVLATGCQQRTYIGGVGGNMVHVTRFDGSEEYIHIDEYWKTPEYKYYQRHPEELQALQSAALEEYKKEQSREAAARRAIEHQPSSTSSPPPFPRSETR
jgi:hypothetical protein